MKNANVGRQAIYERLALGSVLGLFGAAALLGGFLLTGCGSSSGAATQAALTGTSSTNPFSVQLTGIGGGAPSYPAPFVVAGGDFACADFEGVEKCWGGNANGESSVNGLSNVSALAAGDEHACALIAGTVECWGDGFFQAIPISGLPSDVTSIAAGGNFTCAISASQGVLCWGYGLFDLEASYPVTSVGISASGITELVTGHNSACVIRNGAPLCWGLSSSNAYQAPAAPAGIDTSVAVTQIGIGNGFLCVIQSGAAICSGEFDGYGQLSDGSITSGATLLASGTDYSCAVVNGSMECWGGNVDGSNTPTPHSIPGVTGTVTSMSVGSDFACAIDNGAVSCWGGIDAPTASSW